MFSLIRALKRKRLVKRAFPARWEEILEERVGFVEEIPVEEREAFRDHLKVFIWEKHWIGAKDLEVTEEMKVVIAASAARIARGLPLDIYDRLTEIIIYPSNFLRPDQEPDTQTLGEAHFWGTVALSWDAVKHGIANPRDGHDTAVHEFAHVLDVADGLFDGTPELHKGRDFEPWVRVMGEYFARLQEKRLRRGVLRDYGATNEAEFFAVATEAFFERPKTLRREAPELFRELKRFFRVDPIQGASS